MNNKNFIISCLNTFYNRNCTVNIAAAEIMIRKRSIEPFRCHVGRLNRNDRLVIALQFAKKKKTKTNKKKKNS